MITKAQSVRVGFLLLIFDLYGYKIMLYCVDSSETLEMHFVNYPKQSSKVLSRANF